MSFSSDLKRFEKKAVSRIDQARRKIVLDLFTSIIQATPVRSGRAKGNWQTNVGAAAQGVVERLDKDGGQASAEVAQVLATLSDDEAIHLTNNLPYIVELEEGSSQQAPAGFARINVRRFKNIAKQAAAELR